MVIASARDYPNLTDLFNFVTSEASPYFNYLFDLITDMSSQTPPLIFLGTDFQKISKLAMFQGAWTYTWQKHFFYKNYASIAKKDLRHHSLKSKILNYKDVSS